MPRPSSEAARRAHQLALTFGQRGDLPRQRRALQLRNTAKGRYEAERVQESRESMTRMPGRRKPSGPVAKSDIWEVPADHGIARPVAYRGRANYRTGTGTVGKRMSVGAVTGVAKPKRVQPARTAARITPGAGLPTKPPIPASRVGKALSRPAKISLGAGGVAALAASPGAWSTRGVGRDDARAGKPERRGSRRYHEGYTEGMSKRARTYDPETRRQHRLGAEAAATGIGGGALVTSGVRGARRSTQGLRQAGQSLRVLNEPGAEIRFPTRNKGKIMSNRGASQDEVRAIAALSRSKNRPVIVGARHAGKIGGGLALLGVSGAIGNHARSRANSRWR